MKPRFAVSRLILAASISFSASQSRAADYYWDANGATSGTGGTGNWTTTTNIWRAVSDTGILGPWVNDNAAYLGGTAGTLTSTAAITANQINVLSSTSGTGTFSIALGTGGSLGFSGANKTINVASGKTLSIGNFQTTQVSGAGETAQLLVQGGGSVIFSRLNRAYAGFVVSSGTGTTITFSGTNGLDDGTSTTGLNVRNGGTIAVNATNNYRAGLNLGTAGSTGGTLKLGHVAALAGQSTMSITVAGTSKSTVLSTLTNTGTDFGAINGNNTTRNFTVGSTGDVSGVDLEYSAGWRGSTLNKLGAGVFRLNSGFTINRSTDYTTFTFANTALSVGAGTFLNEGTVKSMTVVNGGTAKTGPTSGTYDAVTVNTNGTFELSRTSGSFTSGLSFGAGENSLTLNGGTLKFAGISTDISSSINALGVNGGLINTNGESVTFATGLSGTGSLSKTGAGTLVLNAANTYTGSTIASAGTLAIGASGSLASGVLDVRNGAILDVTALAGSQVLSASGSVLTGTGTSSITGALTLLSNTEIRPGGLNTIGTTAITGNLRLAGLYRADLDSLSNDLITVSGAADLTGASILPVSPNPFASQTYTVLSYGTLTGAPTLDSLFATSRYNPVLDLGPQTSAGAITVTVSGNPADILWTGKSTGVWNLNADINWNNAGSDDVFKTLDTVRFDDSALDHFTITIPSEVNTMGMTFENVDHTYTLTGSGFVSGLGGLSKSGSGTVVLETNNTFSGVIYNDAGILQVGSGGTSGSVGTGNVFNNGKLLFNRSNDLVVSNVISGSGNLEKLGAGKLTLTAASNYNGTTTIGAGTMGIAADNNLGTAPGVATAGHLSLVGNLDTSATFTLAANRGIAIGPNNATGAGSITTSGTAADVVTYNGIIADNGTGTGGLVKSGAGILALGGVNTYSGATTIQSGSVRTSTPNAFGATTSGTTVEAGAWIYILGGSQTSSILEPFTLAGNGAGSGALRTGTGSVRYTLAGQITLSSAATIVNDANTAVDLTNTVSGSDKDFTFLNGNVAATSTLSGSLSLGTGTFIKDGGGLVVLSADNSYGATTISTGTLQIGTGGTTGTLGSGAITNNGTLLINRSDSLTLVASISGSGGLSVTGGGSVVASGTNSYTGTTSVNSGTLLVNGTHSGGGAYAVAATGILGGTGTTSSPISLTGTIAPGNGLGALATGPLTLNNLSTLAIDINTSTATADKIVVTGDVIRTGSTVNLTLNDLGSNVALPNGTKLTLVDYSGTWDVTKVLRYLGNPVANGSTITLGANTFTVKYDDGTDLTLTALVTASPFVTWANGFSTQLPNATDREPLADPDGDGNNNLIEFALNGDPSIGSNPGKSQLRTSDSGDAGTDADLNLTIAVRNGATSAAGPNGSVTLTVDGIVYTIEGSTTLQQPFNGAVSEIIPASSLTPAAGTGWTARTFRLDSSEGLPGKGFLRVKISQ